MKLQSVLTVVNLIVFAVSLLISTSATRNVDGPIEWLFGNQSTGGASQDNYLEITPARWAFSIWYLIYAWQSTWIFYSLSLLCCSRVPEVLSPLFFAFFILSRICSISWFVLFSWDKVQICAVVLLASVLVQCATLSESCWRLDKLYNDRFPVLDYWALQILVNNGIALSATWSSVCLLLNLASAIAYSHGVRQDLASTVSLSILAVKMIFWFILENTVLERFVRFTLTIYPVLIWALSASLAKNFDSAKRNSIFTIVLLNMACVLFFARVLYMIWRIRTHKNSPNDDVTLTAVDKLYT